MRGLTPEMRSFAVTAVVPVALDFHGIDDIPYFVCLLLGQNDVCSQSILNSALGMSIRKSVSYIEQDHIRELTYEDPGKGMTFVPREATQAILS